MNSLKWINTIAFLAMVGVNVAANVIPIGGNTTGEVSKAYPNLFTPAPVTFGIWGVIYAFMLAFVIYQWGFIGSSAVSSLIRSKVSFFFLISCLLNIAWIFTWHFRRIELSTLFIALLLISLIFITKGIRLVNGSLLTYLMVNVGFDIYLGWIIAATIANVSVMLTKLNWNRWGIPEMVWTIIILIVGALIASAIVISENRYFAGLAVAWAYVGIMIKHLSLSGYAGRYIPVVIVAAVGIAMIICAGAFRLIVPNRKFGMMGSNT